MASLTFLLGEYARTTQLYQGLPVYKLEGSTYYFYQSQAGVWSVGSVVGGPAMLSSAQVGTELPPATGWRYYQSGGWITDSSLVWRAGQEGEFLSLF